MPDDKQERIKQLEGKLAASRGRAGFADRVAAIEAELERLRAEQ
jgi:hypothetical protein